MPATTWARVNPAILTAAIPIKGGTMVMATAAKKHLTLFVRTRTCRVKPGRPEVKAAFAVAARGTIGTMSRVERNAKVSTAVKAAGLKTGVYHRRSKASPRSPLFGKIYTIGGAK